MKRQAQRNWAQATFEEQRERARFNEAMRQTVDNAADLAGAVIDPRIPGWAKSLGMWLYRFGMGVYAIGSYFSFTLPGRWDKAMTYDMKLPAPLIVLVLFPYTLILTILSVLWVLPFKSPMWRWFYMQFVSWGHYTRQTTTRQGIRVIVQSWWTYRVLLDQVVPHVDPQTVKLPGEPDRDSNGRFKSNLILPGQQGRTPGGLIIPGR